MEAVQLLLQAPMSTTSIEQGHGSLATVHRAHPQLGSDALCVRSRAHQMRPLFAGEHPSKTKSDRRLQHDINVLEKKRPERLGGRQLFLRELFAQVRSSHSGKLPSSLRQRLFKQHGEQWLTMSEERRAEYNSQAQRPSAEKSKTGCRGPGFLRTTQSLQRQRGADEARRTASLCRVPAPGRQAYPTFDSKLYSKKHSLECPRFSHVSGHPRGPGSYV